MKLRRITNAVPQYGDCVYDIVWAQFTWQHPSHRLLNFRKRRPFKRTLNVCSCRWKFKHARSSHAFFRGQQMSRKDRRWMSTSVTILVLAIRRLMRALPCLNVPKKLKLRSAEIGTNKLSLR